MEVGEEDRRDEELAAEVGEEGAAQASGCSVERLVEVWRREVRGEKREKKDKWEVGRSLSEGGKILAGRGKGGSELKFGAPMSKISPRLLRHPPSLF